MADGSPAVSTRNQPRHYGRRAPILVAAPSEPPKCQRAEDGTRWEFAAHVELVELLVRRRHAIGWTQAELNDRCGFHENYISHLERPLSPHGRAPGPEFMRRWCEVLGVQPVLTVTKTIAEVLEA